MGRSAWLGLLLPASLPCFPLTNAGNFRDDVWAGARLSAGWCTAGEAFAYILDSAKLHMYIIHSTKRFI